MIAAESSARGRAATGLLLAALTFALYVAVGGFEFLNYDDPEYVSGNPVVSRGLSAEGVRWALTSFHAANWHPLTWLAHMLDVECFGLDAGAHHLVSAALHAVNAALLCWALAGLTGRFWPSVLVAVLFAVHPLRVQSVAWVAERKDLLSSAFFLATLIAYARHVRAPRAGTLTLVILFLALGCLAKPMLVTVPFVLLLLDVWPLGRLGSCALSSSPPAIPSLAPTHPGDGPSETAGARGGFGLLLEKLPLFAIAATSCIVTVLAQRSGKAVGSVEALGVAERVLTAGAGYLAYLRASFWPSGLAVFYPHPGLIGESQLVPGLAGAALVLLGSLLVLRARSAQPALFTGWFWFVGMLVPVIGLMQVGDQAWADRYAYLPTIGLYVGLVYPLAELARRREVLIFPLGAAAIAASAVLAWVTLQRLDDWKDSRSLFERALAVTRKNWVAHNNLGLVYLERRELGRAAEHFGQAAAIRPSFVQAHFNLGLAREAAGEFEQAIQAYRTALEVRPGHPESLMRLALLAKASGDAAQARSFYEEAVERNPENPFTYVALARVLLEEGQLDRATNCATSALSFDDSLAEAHMVLAEVALKRGEAEEAGVSLRRAVELAPDSAEVQALLGRWRAISGDVAGARTALERSIAIDPSSARSRYDLGTLLLSLGERESARGQFQAVLDIRPGDPEALTGLAAMLIEDGSPAAAIGLLRQALERLPGFFTATFNLAVAHEMTGEWAQAIERYQQCLTPAPPDPDAARCLAWILATCPDASLCDGEKAVQLATYAVQRMGEPALDVLAAAYARQGDYEQAARLQEQAVKTARDAQQKQDLEARLQLFQAGRPYTRPR